MANNVGRNIRNLRIRADMTQDALAEKLFVSRQTISNYETGRSQPDVDMLVRLAEALHTDAGVLIYGPPVPPDKKAQWLRCALALGCLLVWGVLAFPAGEYLREQARFAYHWYSGVFVLELLAKPLFAVTLGWALLQLTTLFGARQPKLVRRRLWHGLALGAGGAYLLWVLPVCAEQVISELRAAAVLAANGSYTYYGVLPDFLYRPIWFFSWHKEIAFALLFLLGAALWLTGAPQPKNRAHSAEKPDEARPQGN